MKSEERCGSCDCFTPEKSERASEPGIGTCRAGPPTVQLVMVPSVRSPANPGGGPQLTAQGFWPPVRASVDFCYAWRPKQATN